MVIHYGDKIGGPAVPIDVEESVVARLKQRGDTTCQTKLSADTTDEVQ